MSSCNKAGKGSVCGKHRVIQFGRGLDPCMGR